MHDSLAIVVPHGRAVISPRHLTAQHAGPRPGGTFLEFHEPIALRKDGTRLRTLIGHGTPNVPLEVSRVHADFVSIEVELEEE